MSGIEVAGMVIESVALVGAAFKTYSTLLTLLRGPLGRDTHWYSTRLMLERAKLETTVQQLSKFDSTDNTELSEILLSLMRGVAKSLEKAEEALRPTEKPSKFSRNLHWVYRDQRRLDEAIQEISLLNDQLFLVLQVITNREHASPVLQLKSSDKLRSLISARTGESVAAVSERLENDQRKAPALPKPARGLKREQPRGPMLQRIISNCDALLTQFAKEDPAFAEVSNSFRLWKHGIESEGLYRALDSLKPDSRDIIHQDLGNLLFRSMIRFGQVLTWWAPKARRPTMDIERRTALESCAAAIYQVYVEIPKLPRVGTDDLLDATTSNPAESTKAVLRTIELVIRNLGNILPSIVSFTRQHTVQSESIAASDVTRLLDISVDLITPATEAFSKATKDATADTRSRDDPIVDLESIQRVFEEQSAQLQKWKVKHREDIVLKLAENNPAKLASVADAVENIAKVLVELPITLQGEPGRGQVGQTLDTMMKGFEASIQSLVTLEPHLAFTDVPPPYQKISNDRVIISMTGEITPVDPVLPAV